MSVTGIFLGLLGAGIVYACYDSAQKEEAQEQIERINLNIGKIQNLKPQYENLKSALNSGKVYLENAQNNFKNGGHVLDGIPLANSEFESCKTKINDSVNQINTIIQSLDEAIKDLEAERAKWQEKL